MDGGEEGGRVVVVVRGGGSITLCEAENEGA